jgi:hypothetical protein
LKGLYHLRTNAVILQEILQRLLGHQLIEKILSLQSLFQQAPLFGIGQIARRIASGEHLGVNRRPRAAVRIRL